MLRTIPFDRPLDLRLTLGPLRHGPHDPTIRLRADAAARTTLTETGPATIRYRVLSEEIEVEAWGPGAGTALDDAPALLGAEDDPSRFTAHHPVVRESFRRAPGLRMCKSGAVIETLIPTILEQKVTSEEAHRAWSRLIARFGERGPGPLELKLAPRPEVLSEIPYHRFHPLGIERRRADLIRTVARRADALERCLDRGSTGLDAALRSLPGIGVWTSAIVRQTALGDPDAVIVGDYHLPNIVAWVLADEARADDLRMLELLEPYAGQRARAVRLIALSGRAPAFGPRRRLRSISSI